MASSAVGQPTRDSLRPSMEGEWSETATTQGGSTPSPHSSSQHPHQPYNYSKPTGSGLAPPLTAAAPAASGAAPPHGKDANSRAQPPSRNEEDEDDRDEATTTGDDNDEHNEAPRKYGFWSREVAGARLGFIKPLLLMFGITTVILWLTLPIFWGSSLTLEAYIGNLNIHVVDFDSQANGAEALAGPRITAVLERLTQMTASPHLTYQIIDPARYPGGPEQVMSAVHNSGPWGAVVIHSNATSAWRQALAAGTAGQYDPSGSVGLYYSGARFYQVTLLYVIEFMEMNVHNALAAASQAAAANFLCANAGATAATQNAAAIQAASPQALGNAFSSYRYDVNPITAWSSAAPMEAGLIYLTIFTFHFALFSFFGRSFSGLFVRLKFRSLVLMRLATCALMYLWLSFCYTLVNTAFFRRQVISQNAVGHAGFVVLWALTFVTLGAVGLAMESMISLLTVKFFPFFLIFWIITNLSSSFLPLELMNTFYKWGHAWPFFQHVQAFKIIIYGNQPNEFLGRYFGVLFAWTGVNIVALVLFAWIERQRADKGAKKEAEEKERKAAKGGEKQQA